MQKYIFVSMLLVNMIQGADDSGRPIPYGDGQERVCVVWPVARELEGIAQQDLGVMAFDAIGESDSQAREFEKIAQQDPNEMAFDAAREPDWRQMRFAVRKGASLNAVVRDGLTAWERLFVGIANRNYRDGGYSEEDDAAIRFSAQHAILNGENGRKTAAFMAGRSGFLEAVQAVQESGADLCATSMFNDEEVGAFEGVRGSAPSPDGKQEIVDYLITHNVPLAARTAVALTARGINISPR